MKEKGFFPVNSQTKRAVIASATTVDSVLWGGTRPVGSMWEYSEDGRMDGEME